MHRVTGGEIVIPTPLHPSTYPPTHVQVDKSVKTHQAQSPQIDVHRNSRSHKSLLVDSLRGVTANRRARQQIHRAHE